MHEYQLTGRTETDNCIILANKAHNYFFADPLRYRLEFAKAAKEFFEAVNQKLIKRTNESNTDSALKKHIKNVAQYKFISNELDGIKDRLNIIIKNPSLINEKTLFVLEHTARFIEVILPYVCGDIKEEVEHRSKFSYVEILKKEWTFFNPHQGINEKTNSYLAAFYDSGWRAQKELNGFTFIRDNLNLNDPKVRNFYETYGIRDYFASLIFARMANEQFMKYLSGKNSSFWNNLRSFLPYRMPEHVKDNVINTKDNNNKDISMPSRIDALGKSGVLNELIVREAKLLHFRGNNIAHHGVAGLFSTCYHNLELLNYLNKYCK